MSKDCKKGDKERLEKPTNLSHKRRGGKVSSAAYRRRKVVEKRGGAYVNLVFGAGGKRGREERPREKERETCAIRNVFAGRRRSNASAWGRKKEDRKRTLTYCTEESDTRRIEGKIVSPTKEDARKRKNKPRQK